MGLPEFVRPVIEELPLVSSFFGDFYQFFVHTIRNRELMEQMHFNDSSVVSNDLDIFCIHLLLSRATPAIG
jgi:hypothetical protein